MVFQIGRLIAGCSGLVYGSDEVHPAHCLCCHLPLSGLAALGGTHAAVHGLNGRTLVLPLPDVHSIHCCAFWWCRWLCRKVHRGHTSVRFYLEASRYPTVQMLLNAWVGSEVLLIGATRLDSVTTCRNIANACLGALLSLSIRSFVSPV